MKSRIVFLVFFGSFLLLSACGKDEGAVVLEVGDWKVTENMLHDEMKETVGIDVVEQLVLEHLLKERYEVQEEEIQRHIEAVMQRQGFKDEKELKRALKENGTDFDAFLRNTTRRILLEKAKLDAASVREEDVEKEYERTKNMVRVSHVLVEERSEAADIRAAYLAGEDFGHLAREHSKDLSTREDGGDMGYVGKDYLYAALEEAAFSLEEGEISSPIETPFGYHLLLVTSKGGSYEERKDSLREMLVHERATGVQDVFRLLLEEKDVVIHDASLREALSSYR